jgi:pyridoxamine 5'-phosphate oxidase
MAQYEDRKDYQKGQLEGQMSDPAALLKAWLDTAREADPQDYNAMTLSTLGLDGHPAARIVLLREVERDTMSLVFYTNYLSSKGQQLDAHPFAAATFFWRELERQLRVRGKVERLSEADSDRYFASRPRPSQIGAWASNQSEAISSRAALESQKTNAELEFAGEVKRPPPWGGYRLVTDAIEFWQGRPGRLHDRVLFEREAQGWNAVRLQP